MNMSDDASPTPETGTVGAKTIVKDALAVRLKAFFSMDNTRIYREKRFAFLAAASAAILIAAIALPRDEAAPVIEVAEITEPEIDLSRYDMALEEAQPPTSVKTLKVRSGDSLGPLLQNNGLSGGQAYKVTQAFATV